MTSRTMLDLFSGLGGFSLAGLAHGVEPVAQVEVDERCRRFLNSHYGDIQHDDIRTFDGRPFRGVWLLAGGPPCQPASRAGRQRGEADDRWLWEDALRVLGEVRPTWCLFENPPGIADVGLAGILARMEAEGYEVQVLDIPACAVASPQLRRRYWIMGHTNGTRELQSGGRKPPKRRRDSDTTSDLADAASPRRDRRRVSEADDGPGTVERPQRLCAGDMWTASVLVPCADGKIRRAPDDSIRMADGLPVELLGELGQERRQTPQDCEPHRSLLGALGNSIVWPVAAEIIGAMVSAEAETEGNA